MVTSYKRELHAFWITLWGAVVCLFSLHGLGDADVLTQIKLGTTNLFLTAPQSVSHSLLYTSVTTNEHLGWLFQRLAAVLDSVGGLSLVRFFSATLFGAVFVISIKSALITLDREGSAPRYLPKGADSRTPGVAALGAALLLFLVFQSFIGSRAQVVSFCGFAYALHTLQSPEKRALSLLSLLLVGVLWQNIHPSVLLAGVPALVFVIRALIARSGVAMGLAQGVAIGLASLCTPDVARLFAVAAQNTITSREVLRISEWMPPWDASVRAAMEGFWVSAALSVPLVGSTLKRQNTWLLITPLIFLALTLCSARFAPYWGISMVPVWVRALLVVFPTAEAHFGQRIRRVMGSSLVASGVSGAALVATVTTQAFEVPPGVAELAKIRSDGRIYNFYAAAGPLAYFGSERFLMHVDGRLYLFPEEFWIQYAREAQGKVPLEHMVSEYNPDAFYLWKPFQGPLAELLRSDSRFNRVFEDASDVVYVRVEPSQEY